MGESIATIWFLSLNYYILYIILLVSNICVSPYKKLYFTLSEVVEYIFDSLRQLHLRWQINSLLWINLKENSYTMKGALHLIHVCY